MSKLNKKTFYINSRSFGMFTNSYDKELIKTNFRRREVLLLRLNLGIVSDYCKDEDGEGYTWNVSEYRKLLHSYFRIK